MNKKLIISIAVTIFILIIGASSLYLVNKKIEETIVSTINDNIKRIEPDAKFKFSEMTREGFLKPTSVSFTDADLIFAHHNLNSKKIIISLKDNQAQNINLKNLIVNIKVKAENTDGLFHTISFNEESTIDIVANDYSSKYNFNIPNIVHYAKLEKKYIIGFKEKAELLLEYDIVNKLKEIRYKDKGLDIFKEEISEDNLIATSDNNHIFISRAENENKYLYDINILSDNTSIVTKEEIKTVLEDSLLGFSFQGEFQINKPDKQTEKILYIDLMQLNLYGFNVEIFGKILQSLKSPIPSGELDILFHDYKLLINSYLDIDNESVPSLPIGEMHDFNFDRGQILDFLNKLNKTNSDILSLRIRRSEQGAPTMNEMQIKEIVELYQNSMLANTEESAEGQELTVDDADSSKQDEEAEKKLPN